MASIVMFRSIIVDDEPKLVEVLKIKLEKFCPQLQIVGSGSNVVEAKQLIKDTKPDIVFLDIEMPGGSGFDLLDQFDPINFEIIFVTGYHEFALEALKLSAVDYLLKPVKTSDLAAAVERACSRLETSKILSNYQILQQNLNNTGDQTMKVGIPNNDAYEFVQVSDIIRCEGWNKYTKVFLTNKNEIVSSYNIGVFKDMLEPYGFYSCHKSHIVNKTHIKRYLKEGIIVMQDESEVPLARRRKESFVQDVLGKQIIR